jgi:hypothetical protein
MRPPARRHPDAASHVAGGRTGLGSDLTGWRTRQPVNHGPELRGSTPAGARRCFLKSSST